LTRVWDMTHSYAYTGEDIENQDRIVDHTGTGLLQHTATHLLQHTTTHSFICIHRREHKTSRQNCRLHSNIQVWRVTLKIPIVVRSLWVTNTNFSFICIHRRGHQTFGPNSRLHSNGAFLLRNRCLLLKKICNSTHFKAYAHFKAYSHLKSYSMGWLRSVGSIKL